MPHFGRITLHVDGSLVRVDEPSLGRRRYFLGRGVVAAHKGREFEQHRSTEIDKSIDGCHELAAFVEGVLIASSRDFAPEQKVFWSDDEVVGYAPSILHPGNGHGLRSESLTSRLKRLTAKLYTPLVCEVALVYMTRSHAHKLRGHGFLVCHSRVH